MKLSARINTTYVTPKNKEHVFKKEKQFGSRSAYINHLISKDRGLKTVEFGHWKPKAK